MDFRLNEDERALQEGVRSFCAARLSSAQIRALETEHGFDRALWKELAELGVFARQAFGTGGLTLTDAALVFEELGRALVPGPLVWTHLAADLVSGARTGEVVVGGLDLTVGHATPYLVEHLAHLDRLLVLRSDGIEVLDPGALEARPVAVPLDPLTPVHSLGHVPAGTRIADTGRAAAMRWEGGMLVAAQLLGIAEATLDLATAYAKVREQFGRVIGAFQAIKHLLADMFVRQEVARAAAYAAAATLADPQVGDAARAVSGAKLLCGEAARKNARDCIQVHGGMGYTWEVMVHYYLKRAWVLEPMFGSGLEQADRIADGLDRALTPGGA